VVDPPADPPADPPPAPPADQPAPPAGPPEKYELAIPENSGLDQADLDAVAEQARAKGWTNDQAQAAINEASAQLVAQREAYASELVAHPELGGANLEATRANAHRFLDRFLPVTTPEGQALRAAMTKNGMGDWVPFLALAARAGKAMGEDTLLSPAPLTGVAAARQEADAQALRFYPSMAQPAK
jgi:hypothetical protein